MKTHCDKCGSSDANHVYDDGHTHCFACNHTTFPHGTERMEMENDYTDRSVTDIGTIHGYRSYPITSRAISQEVVDFFDTKMSVDQNGKPASHYYAATRKGKIVAYKERILNTEPKEFRWHGNKAGIELYGQSKFSGGRTLVVCEGEIDTKSMAQAFQQYKGTIYPVVGLFSSTGTDDFLNNRDWVNQFDEVVFMLDMDAAGEKATDICAKMVKAGKAKIAKLPCNDVNETLKEHGHMALLRCVWNATSWNPSGIVVGEKIWDQFKERSLVESIPYPDCLSGLNYKLKGIRHGEITLFTSGTGSGKSTVIKEIILDLLHKTDSKVGLVSLEESVGDTAEKFISMVLRKPTYGDTPIPDDELRRGYDEVFGDERLVLLDHQGSVGDSSLIDKIEYMALMGCKYLVLDHITIAVSEGSGGLSGNEAVDKMMSDLLKIVKRHNIWLGLISHLRKAPSGKEGSKSFEEGKLANIDDIKGSGSIKQISFDIIAFARNLVAEEESERNTIQFRVLKSRFTGLTGAAGSSVYDPQTTRLKSAAAYDPIAEFGL